MNEDIGEEAKKLDSLPMKERMKLRKECVHKIVAALLLYTAVMLILYWSV